MDKSILLLNPKSSLEEKDLSQVYSNFRQSSVPENVVVSFKKNEKVGGMAKSMLKHRIQR
ncbi:Uncharacterized protein FKW44_003160 [Caligus rogercresseyi]|uniref:Uncharacterized protein n=1 Tax=Caligus rogercresseyi TaxID=217165 RepID=A0A7T8KLC8_CALRO|nr:Uncharacterized protein FKW44_003160 [Caligus rogercresseyi]